MSDQDKPQEWKPISQGGKDSEPHDICFNGKDCIELGVKREFAQEICDAHNAALAALRAGMLSELEAEWDKAEQRKAANDVLRAENRGLFSKCETLEEANKKFEIVILEGEGSVDAALLAENKQLREQLAAEREKRRPSEIAGIPVRWHWEEEMDELRDQLAAEREKAEKVYADCAERIVELEAAKETLVDVLKSVEGYLCEQSKRRTKRSFADQRAGSDAEDLLPFVQDALDSVSGGK